MRNRLRFDAADEIDRLLITIGKIAIIEKRGRRSIRLTSEEVVPGIKRDVAAGRSHLELERLVAQQELAFTYTLPLCEGLR